MFGSLFWDFLNCPGATEDTRCMQGSHQGGAQGTGRKMRTPDRPREMPTKTVLDKSFLT